MVIKRDLSNIINSLLYFVCGICLIRNNIQYYSLNHQSIFSVDRKHVLRIRTGRTYPPKNGPSQPLCQWSHHWNFEHRGSYLYALDVSYIFQEVLPLLTRLRNGHSLYHSLDPQSQIRFE